MTGTGFALATMVMLLLPQESKLPAPSEKDQKEAEKRIRETFKDDFGKQTREGKRVLAQKLSQQATDPQNTATVRFTCMFLAKEAAAAGLDLGLALTMIDKLDEAYHLERPATVVGAWTMNVNAHKAATLESARKVAVGDEEQALVAEAFMKVAESAMAALAFDDALSAADQATRSTKVLGLTLRAKELARDIPALKQDLEAMRKAEILLSVNPEDPAANLAQGRFLLFLKKDVEKGLLCLSKSSDADLKELARKELAKPASSESAAEVGEGWLSLAGKAKGIDKKRCLDRALLWYEQAVQGTGGLSKARIEKRLNQIEQTAADLDTLTKGMTVEGLVGWWKFDEGYGEKILDSSRSRNSGARFSGVSWVNGKLGGGLRFDGAGGNVTISAAPYKTVSETFTMAIWVKPAGEFGYAVYPTQGEGTWGLPNHAGVGLAVGVAGVKVVEHSSVYVPTMIDYATSVKDWTHLTLIYEKNTPRLYVNGKLVKTGVASTKTVHPGSDMGKPGPYISASYSGLVDDFRIYNRALIESEIRTLASAQK